jgi:integrase
VKAKIQRLQEDKTLVIKRSDVERIHDWARKNCNPRDFLLIRLPMKIGLRTSEIRMLRIEDINFRDRSFQVLDSKKYTFFPLPLDMLTLQLIQDLVGTRTKGYVFTHQGSWTYVKAEEPLSRVQIWTVIHEIAEKAGVKGFNPRILRHYFAAHWYYVDEKSLLGLQRLMRHSSLEITSIYLARLIFWEDLKAEYDSVKNAPFVEFQQESAEVAGSIPAQVQIPVNLEESICKVCSNLHLCKFAPLAPCVTSCRLKIVKVTGIAQYH